MRNEGNKILILCVAVRKEGNGGVGGGVYVIICLESLGRFS